MKNRRHRVPLQDSLTASRQFTNFTMEMHVICLLILPCLLLHKSWAAPLALAGPGGPNMPAGQVQECSALKLKALKSAAATTPISCTSNNCNSAFSVYKLCEQIGNINDIVSFEGVNVNHGGNFDVETGIYTATDAGLYVFSFSLLTHTHPIINLAQNGRHMATVFRSQDHAWFTNYDTIANTVILPLVEGDQVYLIFSAYEQQGVFGMEYDFRYSSFSGYKL